MATLTIKNLPDEIYAALSKTAKQNRRSINSEAIVQLERSVSIPKKDPEELLAEIKRSREELSRKGVYLTDEILEQAKKERRF
ncbi:MAG: Arc family DNA-binding protein [Acidobacteriota bacterium]|nr:Arc family DNA-binding protein [Acidobacteriota bacterium]